MLIGADDFAWLQMSSLRAKVAKFPGWTIIFRDILLWPAASEKEWYIWDVTRCRILYDLKG